MERKIKGIAACVAAILLVAALLGCQQESGQATLAAPSGVAVKAHESKLNTVTVTWQTGANVAEYYWVYYSATNDTASLASPQERVYSSSSWKGTGTCDLVLDKGGTYYFWVRAASGYDLKSITSDFSAAASLDFAFTELTAPSGVAVKAHESRLNTVTVTWQTGANVAEYYWVYYSATNDTASLASPQEKVYSSSLWKGTGTCDIVLDKDGTYYFWVQAANGYDNTSPTSAFSAAAQHDFALAALTAPVNLKAEKYVSDSSSGIRLTWDTTDAPYYHIYWATTNNSAAAKKLTTSSLASDIIYESSYKLAKGTTYYFWVRSANGFNPADTDSAFSAGTSYTYN